MNKENGELCFGYDLVKAFTDDACIAFVLKDCGNDYRLLVKNIMCEYGDVATPWCLSENDKK